MKALASTLLVLSFAVSLSAAQKPVDYSGKWTLDRTASKNLPRMFENISQQKISVTQTAEKFSVALDITRTEGEPIKQTLDFDLTGKPTQTETVVRTPDGEKKAPMTLTAKLRDDGRVEVNEEREMKTPDGAAMSFNTYELWDLSADGKTLTVHRKDQTPRGDREFDMVFTRG
jgi:hypothetical protein